MLLGEGRICAWLCTRNRCRPVPPGGGGGASGKWSCTFWCPTGPTRLFRAHQGSLGLHCDGKGGRWTHVQVTPPVSNFNQTSKTVFSEEEETQQEFQVWSWRHCVSSPLCFCVCPIKGETVMLRSSWCLNLTSLLLLPLHQGTNCHSGLQHQCSTLSTSPPCHTTTTTNTTTVEEYLWKIFCQATFQTIGKMIGQKSIDKEMVTTALLIGWWLLVKL